MKKAALALLLALPVAFAACNNAANQNSEQSNADSLAMAESANGALSAMNLAGTYHGTLPCADCSGRDYTLTLKGDSTYELHSRYMGTKDGDVDFSESGNYTIDVTRGLVMLNSENESASFIVEGSNLIMCDAEGNAPQDKAAYTLMRSNDNEPAPESK